MKFLVIADLHGRMVHPAEDIGAVLIAGDFTNARDDFFAEEVLDRFSCEVYAVPGNMDRKGVIDILDKRDVNVHLKTKRLNKLTVFGFGGSNPTPFNTPLEIDETEIAKMLASQSKADIALFHAPPYGFLDKVNGISVGSKAIRAWIEKNKPLIAICAHIHEHQGVAKIGDTILVKVGGAYKGDAAVVELDGENIIVRFIRFL
jgi:hypothetical protein